MTLNSLKKIIKYRSNYSGTKETDILYKKYFINNLNKFTENELKLLKSVLDIYSDSEIYGIITTKIQVTEIMKEMAKIVDHQNKGDPKYVKMSDDFDRSLAFKTACDLIFKGKEQPSGYTEPLLHQNRLKKKLNLN